MTSALRPPPPPTDLAEAETRLQAVLDALPPGAVVALSGGCDSALLLDAAARFWGPSRVVAATNRSASLPPEELEAARRQAKRAGVEHVVFDGGEIDLRAFRRNAPDRCFHCKDVLFARLEDVAHERRLPQVLDGANADDVGDHRPGMQAGRRRGVISPLLRAGLTKPWIRALAKDRGLDTWDKPAAACLASRFPYGREVTPEGLERVGAAERVLKDLGFRTVRVRDHSPVARVEVPVEDLPALAEPGVRERVVEGIKAAGFAYVALDLEGFRSGSLNETL
ncbi:MAG: ATP-dependent sacrificial sulfur transferase LarE [Planctomycetota bacterium]